MRGTIRLLGLAAVLWLAAAAGMAQTVVTINFDNLAPGQLPGELYAAQGVHFGSGPLGVQSGLSYGDPGGWGLEGTDGSYFLGFNGSPSYSESITFDTPTTGVELDVSRSGGSSAGNTFTLTAYAGASVVSTQTVTLGNVNSWQGVEVTAAGITSVQLSGAGLGFHPFGIDNLEIGVTAVPEPSSWALLALGVVPLLLRRRR